ncbi:MAG TPA: hypothetical protein VG755_22235, partial [Nannocystaceae bacterium]|nr:hypothetical protein [Nannocystaceae bacterium]
EIAARKDIAHAQATVMAEAMGSAKIQIVGGDGQFFDRFVHAVSLGQALDGAVGNSDTAQRLLGGYLDGRQSIADDVRQVLARPATGGNISVSSLLGQLIGRVDGDAGKLESLIARAKELGL